MEIVVNGKPVTWDKPRMTWLEVAILADKVKRGVATNKLDVTVTAPASDPRPFVFGSSLAVVDDMEITVR
jgi:hypothetical protein